MMRHLGINITIRARRDEILTALKKNREEHKEVVAEAREGYVKKARAALEEMLGKVREGKIVHLHFNLPIPEDHTRVYDTAIAMLESHQDEIIELDSSTYHQLVRDQWDWKMSWASTNAIYSAKASETASEYGQE